MTKAINIPKPFRLLSLLKKVSSKQKKFEILSIIILLLFKIIMIYILLHGRELPPVVDNLNYAIRIYFDSNGESFKEPHYLFIKVLSFLANLFNKDSIDIIFFNYWLGVLFLLIPISIVWRSTVNSNTFLYPLLIAAFACSGIGVKSHLHSTASIYVSWLNIALLTILFDFFNNHQKKVSSILTLVLITVIIFLHSSGPVLILFDLSIIYFWNHFFIISSNKKLKPLAITTLLAVLTKFTINYGNPTPLFNNVLFHKSLLNDVTYKFQNLKVVDSFLPSFLEIVFENYHKNNFVSSISRLLPTKYLSITFILITLCTSIHFLRNKHRTSRATYFIAFINFLYILTFLILSSFNDKADRFIDFLLPISFLFLAHVVLLYGPSLKKLFALVLVGITLINIEKTLIENGLFKSLKRMTMEQKQLLRSHRYVIAADPMAQSYLQSQGIIKVINLNSFNGIPHALNGNTFVQLLNCHDDSLLITKRIKKFFSLPHQSFHHWEARNLNKWNSQLSNSSQVDCLKISTIDLSEVPSNSLKPSFLIKKDKIGALKNR